MTTTLACRGISHQQSGLYSINTFKKEIVNVLERLAPKYLNLIDGMGEYMLSYLHGTLAYWANLPIVNANLKEYREAKIVEWFAFWAGYSSMGGKFPPNSVEIHVPPLNDTLKVPENRKIFCVIPIGSNNPELQRILQTTLKVLQNHSLIFKIYCVYDGINSDEKFDSRFSKVETFSTPKKAGPAKARNIGLFEGFKQGCSDVLLLDSDVSLAQLCLESLLHYYVQSHSGIACPLIGATGKTWLDRYHDLSGTLNGRYLSPVINHRLLFGTTSCMLISEQVYNVGISFSPDFPDAAGEDIDYCLQAIFAGFDIAALDHTIISHWYGYNAYDLNNWERFQLRFERYGRGEFIICKKHPYYHFLISHTQERSCLLD